MAPRTAVATLLLLLLTTVNSRALQPEGPTATECRDHIEAAIKNFLSGQRVDDTSDALPTSEIYTRAQSNQDFVAEDDGDIEDVPATLDDHQDTEDDENTIDTPELDQLKHDDKREVKTDDDNGGDDDDGQEEDHHPEEESDDESKEEDGKEEEIQDGGHEADDKDEDRKPTAAELVEDDDDDDDHDRHGADEATGHEDIEDDGHHVEEVTHHEEADDDKEEDEHVSAVHEDEDDGNDHDEIRPESPVEKEDDDDDDDGDDKEDKKEAEEEEQEEPAEKVVKEIHDDSSDEDVEVQIQAPPAVSESFQTAEEAIEGGGQEDPAEEDQGPSDPAAAEEDEDEDQEAEDRVRRDASEDGADQEEAAADGGQVDDESDKPEEDTPAGAAAPAHETEGDEEPVADESAHVAEGGGGQEHDDDVPDEPAAGEPAEDEGKEEEEDKGGDKDQEAGEEEAEEEEVIVAGPGLLRTRENIETILGLGEDNVEDNNERERIGGDILKEIKRMHEGAVRPLETLYKFKDISTRQLGDAEIFSKPMVLFLGPWSTGKSAIINYLLGTEYSRYALKTGAEPTSNSFNVIMYGDSDQVLDGTQLAADWAFSTLQKFGQSFLDRLRGRKMSHPLLKKMTIVDSPGILENRKSTERQYPFNDAFQWFIDRADLIYIVFDPTKLDIGLELEAIFDQLKGRESHVRILLNKADTVKPQELMKVQGTLLWNLSPLLGTSEAPTVFVGSFWSRPYLPGSPETLLDAQEEAFLEDLDDALDHRIENKVALSRRHAVRVRNHAKMVDCYLNTYYNHKSFFSNKRKVADDIVENPQNYHIYEGLSILTNVSRYDLPDPDIYREFFRVHPLFDFKPLASTCSYFKGCPLDKLDIAIAYDLPELVGKYQRLMANRAVVGGR